MSHITLDRLELHYPVTRDHYLSLKRALLRKASLGRLYPQDRVRTLCALNKISLSLTDGDRVGVIGPNGAGKSTLLRVLAGILTADAGKVEIEGAVTSLLSINGGMDIESTGYDNIYVMGRLYGIRPAQMARHLPAIEAFTELGDMLGRPLRSYSEGMKVRLGIAVAACLRPDILIMDEAISMVDRHFIEKTMTLVEQAFARANIIIMASHSPAILRRLCNKGLWLDKGEIVTMGPVEEVLAAYQAQPSAT